MLNCIIIDDDQDEIDIFKMAVSELNFDVDCNGFTDCQQALDTMSQNTHHPDFIFLDSNLSGIDGRECLQKIKAKNELRDIPVVIFSGFVTDEQKETYQTLGALDCIIKANTLTDLREKLDLFFKTNFKVQN